MISKETHQLLKELNFASDIGKKCNKRIQWNYSVWVEFLNGEIKIPKLHFKKSDQILEQSMMKHTKYRNSKSISKDNGLNQSQESSAMYHAENNIFRQIIALVHKSGTEKGIFTVAFDNKKPRKQRAIVWKSTPQMWEKRLRIVFNHCSIFAGKIHVARKDQLYRFNKLDSVAARLGLSKYSIKDNNKQFDDGNNANVLSLWKNLSSLKRCKSCHASNKRLRRCKKCKQLYFCSKLCQKRDWKQNYVHRYYCSIVNKK